MEYGLDSVKKINKQNQRLNWLDNNLYFIIGIYLRYKRLSVLEIFTNINNIHEKMAKGLQVVIKLVMYVSIVIRSINVVTMY